MTEALPTTTATEDPAARPVVPRRTVRVVIDAADDPALGRRLAALETTRRIVVRLNPVHSTTDLVWDVLAAAGKNPAAVHSPRLSVADGWKAEAAWLSAARVTDVIVERAHRLLPGEPLELARLADRIDAGCRSRYSSLVRPRAPAPRAPDV
ncbi:hypothetical protein [Streptomyces sp. NPDC058985]|uniref:hypothetical protein n=1 Tax=Streptomyces sp. NPDC058985 TaxID=3346684 RepID=UPI00369DA03B